MLIVQDNVGSHARSVLHFRAACLTIPPQPREAEQTSTLFCYAHRSADVGHGGSRGALQCRRTPPDAVLGRIVDAPAVRLVQVLKRSGTPQQAKDAAAIVPILRNPHLLLVTLLLCNAAAVEVTLHTARCVIDNLPCHGELIPSLALSTGPWRRQRLRWL